MRMLYCTDLYPGSGFRNTILVLFLFDWSRILSVFYDFSLFLEVT
jgi:hypothetical protein